MHVSSCEARLQSTMQEVFSSGYSPVWGTEKNGANLATIIYVQSIVSYRETKATLVLSRNGVEMLSFCPSNEIAVAKIPERHANVTVLGGHPGSSHASQRSVRVLQRCCLFTREG